MISLKVRSKRFQRECRPVQRQHALELSAATPHSAQSSAVCSEDTPWWSTVRHTASHTPTCAPHGPDSTLFFHTAASPCSDSRLRLVPSTAAPVDRARGSSQLYTLTVSASRFRRHLHCRAAPHHPDCRFAKPLIAFRHATVSRCDFALRATLHRTLRTRAQTHNRPPTTL